MSTITQLKLARSGTGNRSALDRLTVAYARVHDEHTSPLVGCYLCLHNEPRRPRELEAAA
jgi:hypothetical protein